MKETTFAVACKEFFGFREGQKLGDFMHELKQLTDKDRADLIAWFPSVGYTIK